MAQEGERPWDQAQGRVYSKLSLTFNKTHSLNLLTYACGNMMNNTTNNIPAMPNNGPNASQSHILSQHVNILTLFLTGLGIDFQYITSSALIRLDN